MRPVTDRMAFACLTLAVASCGFGHKPVGNLRKTFAGLYYRIDQAADRKDANGVTAYCTPDFVAVGLRGVKSSLSEQREHLRKTFLAIESCRFTTAIRNVRVTGRTAIVIVRSHLAATVVDPTTHESRVVDEVALGRDT